jgi:hypothetical protein
MVATTFRPLPRPPQPVPECLNSPRYIPCHVPSTSLPFAMGSVIELPRSEDFRCDTESLIRSAQSCLRGFQAYSGPSSVCSLLNELKLYSSRRSQLTRGRIRARSCLDCSSQLRIQTMPLHEILVRLTPCPYLCVLIYAPSASCPHRSIIVYLRVRILVDLVGSAFKRLQPERASLSVRLRCACSAA